MRKLFVFILFFLGWECYCKLHPEMVFALPAPSRIAGTLWQRHDRLLYHSLVTIKEMGGGLLLGLAMAFPLSWAMYRWIFLRGFLQAFFVFIQCLPMFALAPLMVLWFGWTYTAIVIPIALMLFFPLTMTLYQGFRSIPGDLLDYFTLHQATSWQRFTKLELPWALPHLVAGFRITVAIAGMGAIAGEWAGGQAGLGLLMLESRRGVDLEMTFAALFCLTFITIAFYCMMLLLERCYLVRQHA